MVVGTKPLPSLAKLIDGILMPLWDDSTASTTHA
jgi:hypothetical protein